MRRLSNQFDPLQAGVPDISVGGANCSTTSCCCCCVVTAIASSIAASRYMYVRTQRFNQKTEPPLLANNRLYALYGFFFFLLALILVVGGGWAASAVDRDLVAVGSVVGLIIHLVIADRAVKSIGVPRAAPALMLIAFIAATAAEAAIWIAGMKLV